MRLNEDYFNNIKIEDEDIDTIDNNDVNNTYSTAYELFSHMFDNYTHCI